MSKILDRFLVINAKFVPNEEHYWLIISDYPWYSKNEYDILRWAKECLDFFDVEGMMIKFRTEEERTLFILRWSNG